MILKVPKKKRFELKFIAYDIFYYDVLHWIKIHKYAFRREYNKRTVNNIYFDSHYYDSYKDNIFGSSSRTKVRYRCYGEINKPTLGLVFVIPATIILVKEKLKFNKLIKITFSFPSFLLYVWLIKNLIGVF